MSKILIIDDDPCFLDAVQILMKHEGHQVECASSGRNGFEAALAGHPDLVILDVMMESVLEGVKVSRYLHQNPATKDIPILMVSAITRTEEADQFPQEGKLFIESYLTKPVDPTMFVQKVRQILSEN
jgi:CheY-like chemotaxis protein